MVWQLVDLQDQKLEGLLGRPGWVQEEPQLFLCDRRAAVEHLEWFWHTPKYPDDSPDELAWREVLARVEDVGGLLRHLARERAHVASLLQ